MPPSLVDTPSLVLWVRNYHCLNWFGLQVLSTNAEIFYYITFVLVKHFCLTVLPSVEFVHGCVCVNDQICWWLLWKCRQIFMYSRYKLPYSLGAGSNVELFGRLWRLICEGSSTCWLRVVSGGWWVATRCPPWHSFHRPTCHKICHLFRTSHHKTSPSKTSTSSSHHHLCMLVSLNQFQLI